MPDRDMDDSSVCAGVILAMDRIEGGPEEILYPDLFSIGYRMVMDVRDWRVGLIHWRSVDRGVRPHRGQGVDLISDARIALSAPLFDRIGPIFESDL